MKGRRTSKRLPRRHIDLQPSNTTSSNSSTRTDSKLQCVPEPSKLTPNTLTEFPTENVAVLLKFLREPLLKDLLQMNYGEDITIVGSSKTKNEPPQKPMTVAQKLTPISNCSSSALPKPAKRKRRPPSKPGKVTKKKKQSSIASQSILQYFEPQGNSRNGMFAY